MMDDDKDRETEIIGRRGMTVVQVKGGSTEDEC